MGLQGEKRRWKRQRMQAIADQAAHERKLREPPAPAQPPPMEPEIIDVPGLVRPPIPRNPQFEMLVEMVRVIRNYGGI